MTFIGRAGFVSNSQVFNPPALPYPLLKGSVSYSDSLGQEPSGSITYEGVSRAECDRIEAAYPLGRQLRLYGVPLEVSARTIEEDGVVHLGRELLQVFSVQVTLAFPPLKLLIPEQDLEREEKQAALRGFLAFSDGLRGKSLDEGKLWRFAREQVVEVGGNTLALPSNGYNKAVLTFGGQEDEGSDRSTTFSPRRPQVLELVEESENPEQPPEDSRFLRDSTSNHDEGGPTKYIKRIRRVDGSPDSERLVTWGFAYLYEDIVQPNGELKGDARDFWRPIEERETQYIYRQVQASTLDVEIRDPSQGVTADGRRLNFVVPPELQKFLILTFGRNRIRVRTNARYLVEVSTRGRRLMRLVQENQTRNTLDPEDPRYELYQFDWIPFTDRTAYLLRPSRGVFVSGNQSLPFSVEFTDYDALPRSLQRQISPRETTSDGQVAVLRPDPNFVEPFFISVESQQASSYAWALDPDGEVEEPEDGEPPQPPPHFMVGQETRNEIRRTVVDPARKLYSEAVAEFSCQDPQFETTAERVFFRDMEGDPPTSQVRQQVFEEEEVRVRSQARDSTITYTVTTPDVADRLDEGGSVNVPEAETLQAAIAAVRNQLRLSGMQNSTAAYRVGWFYPAMKPGDAVRVEGNRRQALGAWRINDISWQLDYQGSNTPLGNLLITCPGTSLTLGLDQPRVLDLRQQRDRNSGSAPTIDATSLSQGNTLGRVLPPLPNRRNY